MELLRKGDTLLIIDFKIPDAFDLNLNVLKWHYEIFDYYNVTESRKNKLKWENTHASHTQSKGMKEWGGKGYQSWNLADTEGDGKWESEKGF